MKKLLESKQFEIDIYQITYEYEFNHFHLILYIKFIFNLFFHEIFLNTFIFSQYFCRICKTN